MKHESRLGGAALVNASAILGRRHVPAVPKSRDLAGATHGPEVCHGRTLAARRAGRKRFVRAAPASADGHDERPKEANKILLGSAMLDQCDDLLGPRDRIVESGVVAVGAQG